MKDQTDRDLTRELAEALESIRQYGSATLSGRVDCPDDRDWQRAAVAEMTRRAQTALAWSARERLAREDQPDEGPKWKALFWEVARRLNCLPSTYVDANGHVLRKVAELAAQPAPEPALNLNDRSVQKRLAAQWGFVTPEPAEPKD